MFRDARATLGRDLDLFVVNSGGSLAQALFVCLLLPVMTTLRGLSLLDLPRYVVDGAWRTLCALCTLCTLCSCQSPARPPACTARPCLHSLPRPSLRAGWSCFRGLTPSCGSDCSGAPLLPVAYVLFNLAFNVAALELIRRAGNVRARRCCLPCPACLGSCRGLLGRAGGAAARCVLTAGRRAPPLRISLCIVRWP